MITFATSKKVQIIIELHCFQLFRFKFNNYDVEFNSDIPHELRNNILRKMRNSGAEIYINFRRKGVVP